MKPATAVLVVSCDSYRDAWIPFFTLLFRYWSDCPYPVFLGSNFETYPDKRVTPLAIGRDVDWSANLLRMLEGIPVAGILLLQEDFLVDRPVDTPRIKRLTGCARDAGAGCLRLMPVPPPDLPFAASPEIGEIGRGAQYRVSLQAAWWRKDTLAAVVRPGESPWQFETLGSRRSDSIAAPFLGLRPDAPLPLDYFTTGIFRGYWEPGAVELCRREHIPIDLGARRMMPPGMRLERALRRSGVPDRAARILARPVRVFDPKRKRRSEDE
jgi:hypothetical protein